MATVVCLDIFLSQLRLAYNSILCFKRWFPFTSRRSSSQTQPDDVTAVALHGRVPSLEEVELVLDNLHRRLDRVQPQPEEHHQVRLARRLLSHQEQKEKYSTGNLR